MHRFHEADFLSAFAVTSLRTCCQRVWQGHVSCHGPVKRDPAQASALRFRVMKAAAATKCKARCAPLSFRARATQEACGEFVSGDRLGEAHATRSRPCCRCTALQRHTGERARCRNCVCLLPSHRPAPTSRVAPAKHRPANSLRA
jgi:hypothetical protein